MEDPAYNGFDGSRAPGIWNAKFRDHGATGTFQEVIEVTQETLIPGAAGKCVDATALCWETSGIISTEQWLGQGTWLFDVQPTPCLSPSNRAPAPEARNTIETPRPVSPAGLGSFPLPARDARHHPAAPP